MFYCLFHLWLNILAELTCFGDREFYKVKSWQLLPSSCTSSFLIWNLQQLQLLPKQAMDRVFAKQ